MSAVHDSASRPRVAGDAIGLGATTAQADRFALHAPCWRFDGAVPRLHDQATALAANGAAPELDAQALFDYLYFHAIPSPRTVYAGVNRLPAGHSVRLDNGTATTLRTWAPAPASAPARDFPALKAEFRQLLQDAVTARLDGGKPGCFLSGGTDSSTVAGMIKQVAGRCATYSIGFDAQGYDEMAFARIAAKHFGTEHHEYYVTPEDLVRSIPQVAAHFDQPFGNSSAVPSYCCAVMARDDGVSRILAGDGGDELFGGNSRYAKQAVFGVWDALPAALRAPLRAVFELPGVRDTPGLKKGTSYIRQASVPMPDRMQTYNLLERLGVADVLEPAFLARVDVQGPLAQQSEVWAQSEGAGLLDRQLAFDWRYTLAENDLVKVRGACGLAGIEVGFPMLDDNLVDFSLRLPPDYKLKGLKLRWFFKEALRGFLPDEILTKKKQGFGLPFGVWCLRHAALNALAHDSLGSLGTRGVVRPQFIRSLLDVRLAEHPHYYGEMVWILMMLEQWLRVHAPAWKLAL